VGKGKLEGFVLVVNMELFPAQPDLSLQISPPNSKPASTWRRTEEEMDLGYWKRALDSRNSVSSMTKPDSTCFELSLSNPRVSESNNSNQFHLLQNNTNCNGNLFHSFQQNQYPTHQQNQLHNPAVLYHHHHHHHQHQQQQGLSQELGYLRPIRGIPVYQNPPHPSPSFPFPQQALDSSLATSPPSMLANGTSASSLSPYQSQGLMRSRFISRFPAKRSMRAPRMRWTTTLHARFVHAVELLGGHESMLHFFLFLSFLSYYLFPTILQSLLPSFLFHKTKKKHIIYAKEIF